MRDTSTSLFAYKELELVAGRAAMVAFVGFSAQAAVTGHGPWHNLLEHLEDPLFHNALFELAARLPGGQGALAEGDGGGAAQQLRSLFGGLPRLKETVMELARTQGAEGQQV